jgi:hypothetical protein
MLKGVLVKKSTRNCRQVSVDRFCYAEEGQLLVMTVTLSLLPLPTSHLPSIGFHQLILILIPPFFLSYSLFLPPSFYCSTSRLISSHLYALLLFEPFCLC